MFLIECPTSNHINTYPSIYVKLGTTELSSYPLLPHAHGYTWYHAYPYWGCCCAVSNTD